MVRIITFGTFDVFHVGHLNMLQRARQAGGHLTVGVSSDALNFKKKGRYPVSSQDDRMQIVSALRFVDTVFIEESLEKKSEYIQEYKAEILIMGDDWRGKFDCFENLCEVRYLPRTPSISTTEIIEVVKRRF